MFWILEGLLTFSLIKAKKHKATYHAMQACINTTSTQNIYTLRV